MEKIIKAAVERGASDLHIKAGDVFRARINGRLVPLTKQRLTPDQTRAIAHKLIPSEEDRAHLERMRDFDCSWGMPGVGRFRVNVLRQRSSFMIVMRVIPFAVPSIESLGLPDVISTLADSERGLHPEFLRSFTQLVDVPAAAARKPGKPAAPASRFTVVALP